MEEDYAVLSQYLLKLEYDSPADPVKLLTLDEDSTADQSNEIKLSVELQPDSGLYHVDLTVICKVALSEDMPVFALRVTYRGVVAVNFSLPDDKIREYLHVVVPQELYDPMCDIIYSVTENSGFSPIEMDYYSFSDNRIEGTTE